MTDLGPPLIDGHELVREAVEVGARALLKLT
jgi:hypothetical protein